MRGLPGVLLLVASAVACSHQAAAPAPAPESRVVFATTAGDVPVTVELADTPAEVRRGLMFRHELALDRGMLFVFRDVEDHPFWMKNTYIPLDMIWVSAELRVLGVVADAAPMDETPLGIGQPSKYVVEVNAGFAARHAIVAGTPVRLELARGVEAGG